MGAGCQSVARSADGLIERHRIRSTAYKRAGVAGRSEEWVTIAPVSRAVAVLEHLTGPASQRQPVGRLPQNRCQYAAGSAETLRDTASALQHGADPHQTRRSDSTTTY